MDIIERDEQWWDKVEEERHIDDIPYSTTEIVAQMARRIVYQMLTLEGDPTFHSKRMFMMQMETGYRELPAEWMEIVNEWCRDHELYIGHGIMALLHFKALFGCRQCGLELRVILDDAYERAKDDEIFR